MKEVINWSNVGEMDRDKSFGRRRRGGNGGHRKLKEEKLSMPSSTKIMITRYRQRKFTLNTMK